MRVLAVSTQGAGHFNPLLPFLAACRRGGHEVLVVVPPSLAATVESAGYALEVGADPPPEQLGPVWGRVPSAPREEAELLVMREIFGRLDTEAMLPAVAAACERFAPDLVLRDPFEFASALTADRLGIRHARVATGLGASEDIALALVAEVLDERRLAVTDRIRASTYLTLLPEALDPPVFTDTLRLREPAPEASPAPLPDWWPSDRRPLVYLTFGSVALSTPMFVPLVRTALEALGGLPVRVLLTIGRGGDAEAIGPLPANVHVEPWVPQADVFADASFVVCHGGSGTTFGALGAGLPLVLLPLFADQPENAERVAAVGAGLVAERAGAMAGPFRQIDAADVGLLRTATERVLADPSFREAAGRIARAGQELPPIEEALLALAARS